MKVFEFINHASIKLQFNGLTVVTDPWFISNAFGSWYQFPSPNAESIFELIDTDEKLGIIVSHGHDDHCDDWFIKKHLHDKSFFCSKFATPGLERRLVNKLAVTTTPIATGVSFGDFKFHQFVNPDFTEYDAVITIETPEFVVIHANDNWHEWPDEMLLEIKKVTDKFDEDRVFLLIQFGIADCFPINYPRTSEPVGLEIINNRFASFAHATQENMKRLGLKNIYYYANQSRFEYMNPYSNGKSPYDMAQEFLLAEKVPALQLLPGMGVESGHRVITNSRNNKDLFSYCLGALENFINSKYRKVAGEGDFVPTKLLVSPDDVDDLSVCYVAETNVWNRILIGELNLESIIIGGSGLVYKPEKNIRNHHHYMSKLSYVIQNSINQSGLRFFREHHRET